MDLNNKTLEVWLENAPAEEYSFGKKVDYFVHYAKLKEYLMANVHSEVTTGANIKNRDELLNDHGPSHIEKVIEMASSLVSCESCNLSPLEAYFLLSAIQLHDVGNLLGREDHEVMLQEIMMDAGNACGRDTIEKIFIRKIAQAHGGKVRGVRDERDTIGQTLNPTEPLNEGEVRPRVIASILRFADELSDDKNRANVTLLKKGLVPKRSEVYHAYASCLESVLIKHKENSIDLQFRVPKEFTLKKFGKLDGDVYVLDEIYNRAMKMHLERIYCMRFCNKIIDIERITVRIEFYADFIDDNLFRRISFTLSDSGYPVENEKGIYGLCEELIDEEGNKMDGEYIKNKISQVSK